MEVIVFLQKYISKINNESIVTLIDQYSIFIIMFVVCVMAHSYVVWKRNQKDNDYTNDDYLVVVIDTFKNIFLKIVRRKKNV